MDKHSAIERFVASREALMAAIQGLDEQAFYQEGVEGRWAIKDLLAHLTSWEMSVLLPLRTVVQGGTFQPEDIPDHLAWNDAQEKLWQNKSLEIVRQELLAAREEVLWMADNLDAAAWEAIVPAPWGGKGTLAELVDGLAWHTEEHTRSIRRWRAEA